MPYTAPINPSPGGPLGSGVQASDYTFTHSQLHGAHLSGVTENPRAHGAVANGSHDDTDAFVKAINNIKAHGVQGAGRLYIPGGYYVVDGDAIFAALASIEGWTVEGDGTLNTVINAKAGASCAFGWDSVVNCSIRDVLFQGGGKGSGVDGFRQFGNSRSNLFTNVRFNQAQNGLSLEPGAGPGDESQNERNTYINCSADNSTVGFLIDSANAQGQLFIGGGASGNGIGFHGKYGWAEFHSFFVSSNDVGSTAWNLTDGWISTGLYSCLDENTRTTVYLGNGTLLAEQTYFQGRDYTINAPGQKFIDARFCNFIIGVFAAGDNTIFWDRFNSYDGGTSFTVGTNAVRHLFIGPGEYTYLGSPWTSGHTRFVSPEGYMDLKTMAAPASPAASYLRVFMNSANSKLTAKDSGGVVHDFY